MLQLELAANKKSELVPCSDRVRKENENRVDSSTNESIPVNFYLQGLVNLGIGLLKDGELVKPISFV
nr:hypothetical protein [Fredinandcohnia onubensis]